MDLYNELQLKSKELDISIKSLRKTGEAYAKAYTDYRIAISKRLVELKKEGYAITLASDIARGEPDIAHLKYKEICNEAIYKANLEAINATKLTMKITDSQLEREWGSSK